MNELILGSASPRRKELLRQMGFDFRVEVRETEEKIPENLSAEKVAEAIAWQKSEAFGQLEPGQTLVTSDTVVVLNHQVLGKPADSWDAFNMLKRLQGQWHTVYTAVVVRTANESISFTDAAQVHLLPMTEEQIRFYLERDQPFDKAGSYGVQDWLGHNFIDRIEGSYFTVMGLPTAQLYPHLARLMNK